MAIVKGTPFLWTDITSLMSRVNAARSKMKKGSLSLPSGGQNTPALSSQAMTAVNGLLELDGATYFTFFANSGGTLHTIDIADIDLPEVGTLIRALPLATTFTEADKVAAINNGFCAANFGFGFSFDGFSFDGFSAGCGFGAGCSSDNSGHGGGGGNSFSAGGGGCTSNNSGHRSFNPSCSCQGFRFNCGSRPFSAGGGNGSFSFSFGRFR